MTDTWLPLNQYPGKPSFLTEPMYFHSKPVLTHRKPVLIKNNGDLIVAVAEWLIAQGHLSDSDCPISTRRAEYYYLVNTRPEHSDGSPMTSPRKLSNGLYIEGKHTSYEVLLRSEDLLKKFGEDPAQFGLSPNT